MFSALEEAGESLIPGTHDLKRRGSTQDWHGLSSEPKGSDPLLPQHQRCGERLAFCRLFLHYYSQADLLKGEDCRNQMRPSFRLPGTACCPELVSSGPSSGCRWRPAPAAFFFFMWPPWALVLLLPPQGQGTAALGVKWQCSVWWSGAWAWESYQGFRLLPYSLSLSSGTAQAPRAF